MATKLAIICPCFNEEEVLDLSYKRLNELMDSLVSDSKIDPASLVVFVNDGSSDKT